MRRDVFRDFRIELLKMRVLESTDQQPLKIRAGPMMYVLESSLDIMRHPVANRSRLSVRQATGVFCGSMWEPVPLPGAACLGDKSWSSDNAEETGQAVTFDT